MYRNVKNALLIGLVCLVLFFSLTQQVAAQEDRPVDVLIYTGSVWWISRPDAITEAQTTKRLLEEEGIQVEITENVNVVKQWMLSTASDGDVNVLVLYGGVPNTIYPADNVQPNGSVAENWIETSDGNTILNHADWIFYGKNGAQGLQNLMDIPEILLWGDDTPMQVTASGKAFTPSLTAFRSDRPFPLNELQGDWFAETVFASDTGAEDATRADPVIVRDGNRGRIAIVHQTHFEDNPKGEVAAEIINYLLPVEAVAEPTDEEVLQSGPKIEGPWLWMVVPTVHGGDAAAASGKDYLAAASGGTVTEQQIATTGATAGDAVGDRVWTSGSLAPTGNNNINDLMNTIGFSEGDININNHVAYGSIILNAPREQNTKMWVGSDDAAKIWLNGTLVHTEGVGITRGTNDYWEAFPVLLKKGKNVLFVAVYYQAGAWSGFFGFEDDAVYTVSDAPSEPEASVPVPKPKASVPGPKIEGPWLWMIAPMGDTDYIGTDWLAEASDGTVTEQQISTQGATEGAAVGDRVWTSGSLAPTGNNNINDLMNTIGFSEGDINNHVAYGSIVLNAPRQQNTKMYIGSSRPIQVWLNGTLVRVSSLFGAAEDYKNVFPVTLKKDKNALFIAVYNSNWELQSGWSGFFGFENDATYTLYQPPIVHVRAAGRSPMYWIDKTAGTLHHLLEEKVEDLLINVQNATCLAVDTTNSKLYWGEKTGKQKGRIRRANLDGTNVKLVKALTSVPVDIALDTADQKLYLINAWAKVQRMNVDGSNFQPNLITNLASPDHLVLDGTGDKIYWTEQTGETTGRIRRANLDGSNVELVKSLTSVPHGLDIDTVNKKLYLINAWGKIQHLNFNGSNYRPNFITDLESPDDLAVDASGSKLYWTEMSGSIRRADLNGENIEDLVTRAGTPIKLALGISPAPAAVAAAPAKAGVPDQTLLFANYPNPFNPETWIPYQLAVPTDVKVTIYDARGVLVRHLELGHQLAGTYTSSSRAAYWDGRNTQGERVASGVYFYRLQTDTLSSVRKMVILK